MYFSESPRHFDMMVDDDTLKNVTLPYVSVHNARESRVFPVPVLTFLIEEFDVDQT